MKIKIFIAIVFGWFSSMAVNAETKSVEQLNKLLISEGVDGLAAKLVNRKWDATFQKLMKNTSKCDKSYVDFSIKMLISHNASLTQNLGDSLEAAMDICPAHVLSTIPQNQVAIPCSAGSFSNENSPAAVAKKLEVRIKAIKMQKQKLPEAAFRTCVEGYKNELRQVKETLD